MCIHWKNVQFLLQIYLYMQCESLVIRFIIIIIVRACAALCHCNRAFDLLSSLLIASQRQGCRIKDFYGMSQPVIYVHQRALIGDADVSYSHQGRNYSLLSLSLRHMHAQTILSFTISNRISNVFSKQYLSLSSLISYFDDTAFFYSF